MIKALSHSARLAWAGFVLARHGVLPPPPPDGGPSLPVRAMLALARMGAGSNHGNDGGERLSKTLTSLGPSYIKLGQFLATRPDMIGPEMAQNLSRLHDRLAPFAQDDAIAMVERELGAPADKLFDAFGAPVAAASIAQVHKARIAGDGTSREVAVKLLRPGIERRFRADLETFGFAARMAERFSEEARRLRPVDSIAMLAESVSIEMDLRLEAAAISEMAENTADDEGFRVPTVDWQHTARRVLTTEWIDGVKLDDVAALGKAGHDLKKLGQTIMQSFLRHAIRDGFFHADMHPGNLFVDAGGTIVAVDFGIMGRLSQKDRRFLAEILLGFITGEYHRLAEIHFEAGYVPREQSVGNFAQALRAIGEPIMGREADDISMGRLLEQLFFVTGQFNMKTQPQLLLLQKTMVVAEGVARTLDPKLNMWTAGEPVVREWMEQTLGPEGRIQDAAAGAAALGRLLADLPETLAGVGGIVQELGLSSGSGANPPERVASGAPGPGGFRGAGATTALWIVAIALSVIAAAMVL